MFKSFLVGRVRLLRFFKVAVQLCGPKVGIETNNCCSRRKGELKLSLHALGALGDKVDFTLTVCTGSVRLDETFTLFRGMVSDGSDSEIRPHCW